MKRKALAAIMAVAMAVSMAGCGGSTSESKDSTQKTETADSTASTGGSVENKDKVVRTGQKCTRYSIWDIASKFICHRNMQKK